VFSGGCRVAVTASALNLPCRPSSYNKKDSEAAGGQARLKDLEAQFHCKEAALATALAESRGLQAALAERRERLQEVRRRRAS